MSVGISDKGHVSSADREKELLWVAHSHLKAVVL